jgi:hypothetical protein
MKLRKMADIPDVVNPQTKEVVKPGERGGLVFDFYNPLKEQGRPNEYATLDEQLTYQGGEGRGGLINAATLVPGLARGAGRLVLGALAKKEMGAATKQAANAAEYMSPRVLPEGAVSPGPGLYGEEAAKQANQAGQRVLKAGESINAAKTFGQEIDPLVRTLNEYNFINKPVLAGMSGVVNSAAGQVEEEQGGAGVQIPEPSMGEVTDMSGQMTYDSPAAAPAPTAAQLLQQALAGNQRIPDYQQRPGNFIQKAGDFINPSRVVPREQAAERNYLQNEIMKRGYVDPETQLKLQTLTAQAESDSQRQTNRERNAQEFGARYAPAIEGGQLEQMYGLPAGSLDMETLRRLATEKAIDPVTAMVMQMMLNQGGGEAAGGAPRLNVLTN